MYFVSVLMVQRLNVSKFIGLVWRSSHLYNSNELEDWKVVDLMPKRVGRPCDIGKTVLTPLYTDPRSISAPKLKDLKDLMCFIPPIHHDFYHQLIGCQDAED